MKIGDTVRTAICLPGIPAGTTGTVKETGRLFVLVSFEDARQGYYSRRQLSAVPHCTDPDCLQSGETVPLGIADTQVPRGSHVCLLPSTEAAALNAIACFAAAGLENGETVVCGVPSKWQAAFLSCLRHFIPASGAAEERDRLVLIRPSTLYLSSPHFTVERQLERTVAAVTAASKDNPRGARAFGLLGRRYALASWWDYEQRLTPALIDAGVLALCVYDCTGWGTESWHMASDSHTYVVRDCHVTQGGASLV